MNTVYRGRLNLGVFHNHRLDNTYKGRYIVRLPDRTLVYADKYEKRVTEYRQRHGDAEEGAGRSSQAGADIR